MAQTDSETLTGRAPTTPIDSYVRGGGAGSAGKFERYHDATGGSYENTLEARTRVNTTVTYPTSLYVRQQADAGAVISSQYGIWINSGAPNASATIGNQYAVNITVEGDAVPTYQGLFRLYNSDSAAAIAIDSVFNLANSGGTPFTNLFDFSGQVAPVSAGSDSTNVTEKVACLVGASTRYIHLFSD